MSVAAEPEFVIRERVPVYDAHELEITDPRTGKVVRTEKVTKARLQKIADARNAKIERTGDESPLIVGHTRRGVPEWEQPPIVGYACEYEVGDHPDDGRPTLYARMKFYASCDVGGKELSAEEIMRRFPRRSAEIWLDDNDLDSISLLGPTTPARYLGLVRNAKADAPDTETPDMDPTAAPAAAPAAAPPAMDLPTFLAALTELIAQAGGGAGGAPPPAPASPPPAPAQYACGPTNAALPDEPKLEKVRMQHDQDAIRVRRVEEENAALKSEFANLKFQYQRECREKDVIQLEAEGYEVDRAEEVDRLAPLSQEDYVRELGRIRKYHRRIPAGMIRTADLPKPPGQNTIFDTVPLAEEATEYMLKRPGMTFTDAYAAVKSAQN